MTPDLLDDGDVQQLPIVDGTLKLWRQVDLGEDHDRLLARLIDECDWRQQEIRLFGKTCRQPRLSAWYGDLGYRYSGLRLEARPWPPLLQGIRRRVERLAGYDFNSVLLNYYRDQDDSMGMHSDDEKELGPRPVIASLSLGETRDLLLRHKTRKDQAIKLALPGGSLLLMQGELQRHWRHGINAQRRPCGARVNLTFRRIFAEPPRGAAQ